MNQKTEPVFDSHNQYMFSVVIFKKIKKALFVLVLVYFLPTLKCCTPKQPKKYKSFTMKNITFPYQLYNNPLLTEYPLLIKTYTRWGLDQCVSKDMQQIVLICSIQCRGIYLWRTLRGLVILSTCKVLDISVHTLSIKMQADMAKVMLC